MNIKYHFKENAESLIAKAFRENRGILELLLSGNAVYKEFLAEKPELIEAITDYVSCVKRLKAINADGLLGEFSEVSKRLIKAFDFVDLGRDREFILDAYIYGKKAPLYLALEAAFNAALFQEEGLQRRFKAIYNISRNIIEFNNGEYFLYAAPYIYYVNAYSGKIWRCKSKINDFECFDGDCYNVWYNSNREHIYADCTFLGEWTDATYIKKSGGKNGTTYKYVSFGKGFSMPAHQVIILCFYNLNVLKFCLGSGSVATIDHISSDSLDNNIMNLSMVSRVGNAKKGSGNFKPVNFLQLFEALQIANAPFEYRF